jgi:hypothetical protein
MQIYLLGCFVYHEEDIQLWRHYETVGTKMDACSSIVRVVYGHSAIPILVFVFHDGPSDHDFSQSRI